MHEHYTRLGEELPAPLVLALPVMFLSCMYAAEDAGTGMVAIVVLGALCSYRAGRVRRYKWSSALFFISDLIWPGLVVNYLIAAPPSNLEELKPAQLDQLARVVLSFLSLWTGLELAVWNAGSLLTFFTKQRLVRITSVGGIATAGAASIMLLGSIIDRDSIDREFERTSPPFRIEIFARPVIMAAPAVSAQEIARLEHFGRLQTHARERVRKCRALLFTVAPTLFAALISICFAESRKKIGLRSVVELKE